MPTLDTTAPLAGVTAVDVTTSLGEYTGRLLADLGAEVIRIQPTTGHRSKHRDVFMNAGKHIHRGAPDAEELDRLLSEAQILLTSEGPAQLRARGLDPADVSDRFPGLIYVAISPFGLTGPHADRPASDLTLMAAGGLLALAGDPDREPLRAWGEQTSIIAGAHAATATLMALHVLEADGVGQVVDVSVQEAVAHSLENAAQYFDLEGVVRRRVGAGPQEAGTGLFRCADGWIYLVGGLGGKPLAWPAIHEWLVENGVDHADELDAEQWQQAGFRRSEPACIRFREIFEGFAATRTKSDLFAAGQKRGISIAPVATPDDLMTDPQLVARNYFRVVDVDGSAMTLPGPPYRFRTSTVGPASSIRTGS